MNTSVARLMWVSVGLVVGAASPTSAQEPMKLREIRTFALKNGPPFSLAISPDGKQILVGDAFGYGNTMGTVRVWDAESGKLLFQLAERNTVRRASYSPDGKRILTAGLDQALKTWDAGDGKLLVAFEGHAGDVFCATFSPDGKHIVSSGGSLPGRVGMENRYPPQLLIWDGATGKQLRSLPIEQKTLAVAISPDGKQIAGNTWEGKIIIWEFETGKKLRTLTAPAMAHGLMYSRDGKRILSPSKPDYSRDGPDPVVIEWDAESGKFLRTLKGPKGWLPPLATSPDGKLFASGARDESLKVWDAESGRAIAVGKHPRSEEARRLAFSPDGKWLVEGNGSYRATVWAWEK